MALLAIALTLQPFRAGSGLMFRSGLYSLDGRPAQVIGALGKWQPAAGCPLSRGDPSGMVRLWPNLSV